MDPSPRLSGTEVKRLQEALVSAFPTRSEFAQMVRVGLEENLEAIAAVENLRSAVFELIRWAEAQGRLDELIGAARSQNPGNPLLRAFAKAPEKPEREPLDPTLPSPQRVGPAAPLNGRHESVPVEHKLRLLVRHSASPKDVALVEELLGHLRPLERFAGIDVWSEARIRPGDDWRREVHGAVQEADVVLLLLSADFLYIDGLVDVEVPQLLERHRAGNLRVIPVVLRTCLWDVHPWLKELHPVPRNGRAIGSFVGDERDAVLTEVVREIVSLVATSRNTGPTRTADGSPPSTLFEGPRGVPINPVPHFLGRDHELAELRAALASNQAVCIVATGLGGIGKTSLVRQFVATEAPAMFPDGSVWIDTLSLDADAARVCKRFGFRGERRPTVAEAAYFLAGALNDKCVLVVLDNVWPDGIDVTALPIVGGKSRTVITSRSLTLHETLGRPAHALTLGRWTGEACLAYLRDVVPALANTPDQDLDALAAFVSYLPLAVRLLARLLMRRGMTPPRLLDKLKREPLNTLDKGATGADRGVVATFKVEYDEIATRWRSVLQALAACAAITTEPVLARVTGLKVGEVADVLDLKQAIAAPRRRLGAPREAAPNCARTGPIRHPTTRSAGWPDCAQRDGSAVGGWRTSPPGHQCVG